QAQRLGELAGLHQAVDVGALEAGLGFDFGAAQDAMLGLWKGLRRHGGHSLTLIGAVRKVPRIEYTTFGRVTAIAGRETAIAVSAARLPLGAAPARAWPTRCARPCRGGPRGGRAAR